MAGGGHGHSGGGHGPAATGSQGGFSAGLFGTIGKVVVGAVLFLLTAWVWEGNQVVLSEIGTGLFLGGLALALARLAWYGWTVPQPWGLQLFACRGLALALALPAVYMTGYFFVGLIDCLTRFNWSPWGVIVALGGFLLARALWGILPSY